MTADRHDALLVVGTTSGAGKSTVTAALCRLLADRSRCVAPFKAQNMSNHAAVTRDGGEVGRAQAVQALAARVEVGRRMNPILLKPGSDHRSHVVVLGEETGVTDAVDYTDRARALRPAVLDAVASLRVAAIQLPRLANPSDLDPLLGEPAVELWWTSDPSDVRRADMVVLPGSRATVDDLAWLRATGIADALASTTATVVGVCAGFQMLVLTIDDTVESGAGAVLGLGLLDTDTTFRAHKIVRQRRLDSDMGRVLGYEIRFGRPTVGARPWFTDDTGGEGAIDADGRVFGTSLHGLFDQDGFRRSFLGAVADRRHRCYRPAPDCFADQVDGQLDRLARWLDTYADADAITRLGAQAVPAPEMPGW